MKILIATGGSGGHIFPALVTAKELRARHHEVVFAGVFGQDGAKIKAAGFELFEIGAHGFYSSSLQTMLFFATVTFRSFWVSLRILGKVNPDVVIGFGGYGAFPLAFAAALQGFPTMIHEQNVLPGKANRVLTPFVKKIAVSFSSALKNFPSSKTVLTGCPSRPIKTQFDRLVILKEFGLSPELGKPTILILGGSQGSRRINSEFIRCVPELNKKIPLQVIHLSGKKDFAECKKQYEGLGIPFCIFSFTDEIDKAYAVADVVISRAGAMTITELAAFTLRAILIPYPYAGGHQKANAAIFVEHNVSRLIEEKDLSPEILQTAILEILATPMTKEEIAKGYEGIYRPDANIKLADEIEKLKK